MGPPRMTRVKAPPWGLPECHRPFCPAEWGVPLRRQPVFIKNFPCLPQISHIIREIRQFQQTAYKIEHQAKVSPRHAPVTPAFARPLLSLPESPVPPPPCPHFTLGSCYLAALSRVQLPQVGGQSCVNCPPRQSLYSIPLKGSTLTSDRGARNTHTRIQPPRSPPISGVRPQGQWGGVGCRGPE